MLEAQGVRVSVTLGGVVEDDPGVGVGVDSDSKVLEEGVVVAGIVGARGAVEAIVDEFWVAAGVCGLGGAFGRVGGYAGHGVLAEEAIGFRREPGGVAGLKCCFAGIKLTERGEEIDGEERVEGQRRRKLEEERAEFWKDGLKVIKEGLEEGSGVAEPGTVGEEFWGFDGKAKVGWSFGGPAGPGRGAVQSVEGGIDFGAVKGAGVASEVGAECIGFGGKGPAGGADTDGGEHTVGSMPERQESVR